MKFDKYLGMAMKPEWSGEYIAYNDMKRFLIEMNEMERTASKFAGDTPCQPSLSQIEEEFFHHCEHEISKVDAFFTQQLSEVVERMDRLRQNLEQIRTPNAQHSVGFVNNLYLNQVAKNPSESKIEPSSDYLEMQSITPAATLNYVNDLQVAFKDVYVLLLCLKNYQTLNKIGFCKILSKFDGLFRTKRGRDWRIQHVDDAPFHTSSRIDKLLAEMELLYGKAYERDKQQEGIRRFRVMLLQEKPAERANIRLKFYIALLCLLLPAIIITASVLFGPHSAKSFNWRAGVHLYRSSFLIFVHIILSGVNFYDWSNHGINYVAIFDLDDRDHLTYDKFFEIGTLLLVLWSISFLSFLVTFYFDAYPFVQPFAFVMFLILLLFNPMRVFYHKSRRGLVRTLGRVLLTPFVYVKFNDFWIANQLTSLELVFFDIEFFVCFYANRSNWHSSDSTTVSFCSSWAQIAFQIFLKILPAWFRFAQCLRRYRDTKCKFPDLVNAAKYASGFLVSITNALRRLKNFDYHHHKLENPFFYAWIVVSLVSSTWKIIWDIKIACGFLHRDAGDNKYLRRHLLHRRKAYYYSAIAADILLRYLWMINIFLHFRSLSAEYSDLLGFALGLAEVCRRIGWNSFRLENEQLNNVRKFPNLYCSSASPNIPENDPFTRTIDSEPN